MNPVPNGYRPCAVDTYWVAPVLPCRTARLPYRFEYVVDEQLVHAKLDDLLKKQDLSRYVL